MESEVGYTGAAAHVPDSMLLRSALEYIFIIGNIDDQLQLEECLSPFLLLLDAMSLNRTPSSRID
jgi:hypothetical protein